jgi:hypothetical protein
MGSADRRNPYVILGIPFGASSEQARSGFARMTRRLRQKPDSRYTKEDLTWALHQVELIIKDPELAFEVYRVPASPTAFSTTEPGVFRPAPHGIARQTEPNLDEWESTRQTALSQALRRVLAQAIEPSSDYIPYE